MTPDIVTLEFEVTQVVAEDWNRIDVYCPGTAADKRLKFQRNITLLTKPESPYMLAAIEWFNNHPEPKVWKVGDVVPAGTAVGKYWTAAPIPYVTQSDRGFFPENMGPRQVSLCGRVILWIES